MIQGAIQAGAGTARLQRAQGRATLSVALSRGESRLVDLSQSGAARIVLPHASGLRPEAVFLNTSGGLTSGDMLEFGISVAAEAGLTATTQTAERAYLAPYGPARLTVEASVGAGGQLDWLPQETILFQGADLHRETRVDLQPGASCLMVETIVLGRRAMGEVLAKARLIDRRTVTVQGRPLYVEALKLTPEALVMAGSAALMGTAHAFATLAFCGPGAETAAKALQDLPAPDDVTSAASGWNGRTLLRASAADLWPLKLHLGRVIARLTGRPLPRVWQMQGVRG
jgi:urease accessory protein